MLADCWCGMLTWLMAWDANMARLSCCANVASNLVCWHVSLLSSLVDMSLCVIVHVINFDCLTQFGSAGLLLLSKSSQILFDVTCWITRTVCISSIGQPDDITTVTMVSGWILPLIRTRFEPTGDVPRLHTLPKPPTHCPTYHAHHAPRGAT